MPMPNQGESHDSYMQRCMADPGVQAKCGSDAECQRLCEAYWNEGMQMRRNEEDLAKKKGKC